MKSITRYYPITIGIAGNGHAHFDGIPFKVKQINVKSVVVDDGNGDGSGSLLPEMYYVLWCDAMPNTPLSIISGSSTITTYDGTIPIYQTMAPNGLSTSQISYYVEPAVQLAGQIQFRLSTLLKTSPTLDGATYIGVILEFISEDA